MTDLSELGAVSCRILMDYIMLWTGNKASTTDQLTFSDDICKTVSQTEFMLSIDSSTAASYLVPIYRRVLVMLKMYVNGWNGKVQFK